MATISGSAAPPEAFRKRCWYGSKCRNKKCRYFHPPKPVASSKARHDISDTTGAQPRYSGGTEQHESKDPLRSGSQANAPENNLEHQKQDFGKLHHSTKGTIMKQNANRAEKDAVATTTTQEVSTKTDIKPESGPGGNKGGKKSRKKCRYGDRCYNPRCIFLHPHEIVAVSKDGDRSQVHQHHPKNEKFGPEEQPPTGNLHQPASPEVLSEQRNVMWAADLEEQLEKESRQQRFQQAMWATDLEDAIIQQAAESNKIDPKSGKHMDETKSESIADSIKIDPKSGKDVSDDSKSKSTTEDRADHQESPEPVPDDKDMLLQSIVTICQVSQSRAKELLEAGTGSIQRAIDIHFNACTSGNAETATGESPVAAATASSDHSTNGHTSVENGACSSEQHQHLKKKKKRGKNKQEPTKSDVHHHPAAKPGPVDTAKENIHNKTLKHSTVVEEKQLDHDSAGAGKRKHSKKKTKNAGNVEIAESRPTGPDNEERASWNELEPETATKAPSVEDKSEKEEDKEEKRLHSKGINRTTLKKERQEHVDSPTHAVDEQASKEIPSPSSSTNVHEKNTTEIVKSIEPEESEADRKRRWQEELRNQKERAAEKKKDKKKKRHERFLQELAQQTETRVQFWEDEIANEQKTIDMLVRLCAAEFCRKNPDLERAAVLQDPEAEAKLRTLCQEAFRELYKADIHSRVVVKGSTQQDLNDRTGNIQHWDKNRGKFHVGLDTKKGKNPQFLYFVPGNLEALPLHSASKKKKKDPVFLAFIPSLYEGNDQVMLEIQQSVIENMKAAASVDKFLDNLMLERDDEEVQARLREEEQSRLEEEARRRRAEQRRRENEEWEQRKHEYAERKERLKNMRREHQRRAKEAAANQAYDESYHDRFCNCPECQLENEFARLFFEEMFGARFGGSRFGGRSRGPSPFSFFFDFGRGGYDSDEEYDYFDDEYERIHEEEEEEKNKEAAELLGVDREASATEVRKAFYRLAREYHPDKHRDSREDGLSKSESEEHFKLLQNAYDRLMSNFDD